MTYYNPANSKFKITTALRHILLSDERFVNLVGDKVFPLFAPEGTEGDIVLYTRDEYSLDYSKMGITTQSCNVYINVVSSDYDRGQDIAELIFDILQGDFSDGMKIRMLDSTEDYADKKYIQVLLFSIE